MNDIDKERGFLCPNCSFGDFGLFRDYKPKFCPNCGNKIIRDKNGKIIREKGASTFSIIIALITFIAVLLALLIISIKADASENDLEPEDLEGEIIDIYPMDYSDAYIPEPEIDWDWEYVMRVVAQEAGLTAEWLSDEENDSRIKAQMAIAQCIKTTSEATGMTPEEVVKVPNQYAKPYMGNDEALEMVNESCLRVFRCDEKAVDEPIRYFYSTAGGFYSSWHENNLIFVTRIGPTKFFKEA